MFRRNYSLEKLAATKPKVIQFEPGDHDSGCADCKNNKGFELHHSLVDAFNDGEVVIFAGAGISTEGANVATSTFFDQTCASLDLNRSIAFPDAMEALAQLPNGRIELVTRIKK